jgi:hypothetical protein
LANIKNKPGNKTPFTQFLNIVGVILKYSLISIKMKIKHFIKKPILKTLY